VERRLDIRLPADKKRRQRQKWGDRLWLDEQDVAYCVRDVLYLGPLAVVQWACATPGQRHALRLEQELADVMTRISINGLPVDRSHLVAAKARYQAQMQEARERLRAILGNVNPNAFAQVRAAINARYGTSLTSVDKDSRLEAMLAGVPWAEAAEPYHAYQAAQALERLCKPEQIADDGRIHGLYEQLGARSGRMSARKPNTQQIPRAIRRAFVAPAGYVVISIDFSAASAADRPRLQGVGAMSLPSPRLVGTMKCCPQAPFIYLNVNGVACPRPSTCVAVSAHDRAVTGTLRRTIHGGRS
jgi:DNA polymerase I-like protein with 3'-5' exonuclease and polymerase domains